MRYEQPVVLDLNARPVEGRANLIGPGIELCYTGATAGGENPGWEVCVGGGAPGANTGDCAGGSLPNITVCSAGNSPTMPGYLTDCYAGSAAADICSSGSGPGRDDPWGCNSGPSNI